MFRRIIFIFVFIVSIYNVGEAQIATYNHADREENKNMVVGKTTLYELSQNTEFWNEYLSHYASFSTDKEKLDEIYSILNNDTICIVAVIGTWCDDTKEQFPIFQKIFDHLKLDHINIEYIGVNRDKLAGETDISSLGIILVPTFIFYYDDRERGRIVEMPEETMEEHILKIISN